MKSKFLLFLVLILAVSTLLIACGGDDPADTTAPATSAPATSAPAVTSAPATSAPAAQEPLRTEPAITTKTPEAPVTPPEVWSPEIQ